MPAALAEPDVRTALPVASGTTIAASQAETTKRIRPRLFELLTPLPTDVRSDTVHPPWLSSVASAFDRASTQSGGATGTRQPQREPEEKTHITAKSRH